MAWLSIALCAQEFVSGNIVDCQFSGNTAKDMGGGIAQVTDAACRSNMLSYCTHCSGMCNVEA